MSGDGRGLRDSRAIARRAVALCVAGARGEGLNAEAAATWVARFGIADALTGEERKLVFSPRDPEPDDGRRFQWGLEAAAALLWILGRLDDLGPPTATTDAGRASEIIASSESVEQLADAAPRRPEDEVRSEAEGTALLFAECKDAADSGRELPPDVLPPVLYQRHRAFQWALDPEADWDEGEMLA